MDSEIRNLEKNEYGFSALIEQEIRRGRDIIICPFKEEGKYFKKLLNEKYGIDEEFIIDDDEVSDTSCINIVPLSDVANMDMSFKTVVVTSDDYNENIDYVLKLYGLNMGIRVLSLYGAVEYIVPDRKQFIENVRMLTEVKVPETDKPFVRVGATNDGGYVMLDDFSSDMKAYSYGINDDVTWDKQMATNYGMDIYMYDHTIEGLPEENVHFHYYKKGVAGVDRPSELLYSIKTCLADNEHLNNDNLILKMDVEGAEWDVLNNTSSEILGKFRQIAFEFHDFEHREKETEIIAALRKLNETHYPVWVHGNNHSCAICTEDIILPTAFEVLYLNKRYYPYEEKAVSFPWILDTPNTEVFPEYILGNWGRRDDLIQNVDLNDWSVLDNSVKIEDECESHSFSIDNVKKELLEDIDFIGDLSDKLLCVMSVYGPKSRVHLADTSSMQNAVVNTMSGEVYVGENTFCGHNVSIITGSHDATAYGEERMQFPYEGNDIVIGNGVWLCSNTVVLGPCRIADNAVVAAGAVVMPGTSIGEGELWAGVPAVYKKKINSAEFVSEEKASTTDKRQQFDTLVMVTPKDYLRVECNYKRMVENLPSNRLIFVGNSEVGELVKKSSLGDKVGFICEDEILIFDEVNTVVKERLKDILKGAELPRGITGWYYQQFLKMKYATICENEYYMTWDGDTVPCKKFKMFNEDGIPFIDYKHEYNAPYFETMGKLISGMCKFIEASFISEHLLFNCDIMRELISDIEANDSIPGDKFYEKIINVIDPEVLQDGVFSEFETYGSYVCMTHPELYKLREWHSFRLGGEFFDPERITDRDYEWLSKDFEAISFEKGHFVRDDHKNLFDNPMYQEKLSARQMLEIAQEEFKEGYIEKWE